MPLERLSTSCLLLLYTDKQPATYCILVECYALLASAECARKIISTYNVMVCAVPVTYK